MAYEVSPSFFAYASSPVSWAEVLREQLTGNLRSAFDQFTEGRTVPEHRRHFLPSAPTKTIAEFAEHEEIDVMMGTLTHIGTGKVLGSTADQILYKVPAIIPVSPPVT